MLEAECLLQSWEDKEAATKIAKLLRTLATHHKTEPLVDSGKGGQPREAAAECGQKEEKEEAASDTRQAEGTGPPVSLKRQHSDVSESEVRHLEW